MTTYSRQSITALRSAMRRAHTDVGVQRISFLRAVKENQLKPGSLSVAYGRNGNTRGRSNEAEAIEVLSTESLAELVPHVPGSAPGNKRIGSLIVPCGLCLIVGAGGIGKSPLAQALALEGSNSFAMVRHGEPLAGYSHDPVATAIALEAAFFESADIVLDSIKDLLAESGNAMKGGISRSALLQFGPWASLACITGSTIYSPFNPTQTDKETLALAEEAAVSNATSVLINTGGEGSVWTLLSRTGEGLVRTQGVLNVSYGADPDSLPIINSAKDDGSGVDKMTLLGAELTTPQWNAAVRRALSQINPDTN